MRRVWEIYWEDTFERSLAVIGLTVEIFEKLGQDGVAALLHADPYEPKSTFDVPGTGHRYINTRYRWPDLPAMLIAYSVDDAARAVTVKGVKKIWDEDLVPEL